ncbi:hypothetical protein AB0E85_18440 [Streptomyces sp. NPDC029044]|uniref:DUF7691 family protein n=1 Tax=Streptomyces sp. NPDC029044 TaxID=3157198 RepID=UPI0033D5A31D
MTEQYLSAYAIDADAFLAIVGSDDDRLVRTALGRIGELTKAHELLRATKAIEVEPALREIVADRLDPVPFRRVHMAAGAPQPHSRHPAGRADPAGMWLAPARRGVSRLGPDDTRRPVGAVLGISVA